MRLGRVGIIGAPLEAAVAKVAGLLRPGRVVLIGEIHGTVELPALVADVANRCVTAGTPIHIGLELPSQDQATLERFLADPDREAAGDRLLKGGFWRRPPQYQDGRSSVAMADLLESLRHLSLSDNKVAVTAIDAWDGRSHGTDRDEMMADHLVSAVQRHSACATVVLAGNGHTRTAAGPGPFGYTPMGWRITGLLDDVISLRVVTSGGTAWNIVDPHTGAGVHPVPGGDLRPLGHHDVLLVGPVTASPPAMTRSTRPPRRT